MSSVVQRTQYAICQQVWTDRFPEDHAVLFSIPDMTALVQFLDIGTRGPSKSAAD